MIRTRNTRYAEAQIKGFHLENNGGLLEYNYSALLSLPVLILLRRTQ